MSEHVGGPWLALGVCAVFAARTRRSCLGPKPLVSAAYLISESAIDIERSLIFDLLVDKCAGSALQILKMHAQLADWTLGAWGAFDVSLQFHHDQLYAESGITSVVGALAY